MLCLVLARIPMLWPLQRGCRLTKATMGRGACMHASLRLSDLQLGQGCRQDAVGAIDMCSPGRPVLRKEMILSAWHAAGSIQCHQALSERHHR